MLGAWHWRRSNLASSRGHVRVQAGLGACASIRPLRTTIVVSAPTTEAKDEHRMQESAADIAQRLTRLGFSQYEARTYVGLLMSGGATGYALANDTGVPQPKVYETLRRLVDRGAARLTGEQPARYAAVPPAELLKALEHEFAMRVKA